jgi:hypothetical protein
MFMPAFQEVIMEVLQCLDANGGPDAVRIIKSKVSQIVYVCVELSTALFSLLL